MTKRVFAAMLAVVMCLTFAGCEIFDNSNDMVAPPELTGEMSLIAEALYKSTGDDCDLEYPTSGERRSAFVLEDINGDGVLEAFAFYKTSEDEMTTMHINVISQQDGEWISVSDQTTVAIGVEMIDFCDLDGDGAKEILVGWEVNGNNEKQLSVFTFDQKKLTQLLLQSYTSFMCCDLDSNGINEIFVHLLNTAENANKAMIYNYLGGQIAQTAGCVMDGGVKSTEAPVLSTLSNGNKAIYIDEIKGVGAVTEIIYLSDGELLNPLLDTVNSFENILTLRAASLRIQDIDSDGILEIPVATELQNAEYSDEKLYYTNWCSFDGEKLTVENVTVVNTVDGYYLTVPKTMVGYVAVKKDIEKHERKFYHYDSINNMLGKHLFTIKAVSVDEWSKETNHGKKVEISRTDDMVFVAEIGDGAPAFAITIDLIKSTFNLVQ